MATPPRRPHRLRDIAEQSGLSPATVDRVLHGRAGASARAVRAVEQAVLDLDRQQAQLRLAARTLMLDVVMQAPAASARLSGRRSKPSCPARDRPPSGPASTCARAPTCPPPSPSSTPSAPRTHLPRGPAQGAGPSRGGGRVAAAAGAGVPVVTLVTDVRDSGRIAYVGLDNAAAGSTAAYLVSQWLEGREGEVLLTLSRSSFFGEWERADAFTQALARLDPGRRWSP